MNFSKKNIIFLMKNNNLSRSKFCEFTNISINTLKGILDKNNEPSLDTLIKIRNYFNISLDELVFTKLEKEEKKNEIF